MRSRRAIAVVCGIVAAATFLAGLYGLRTESPVVLSMAATPLFAVLSLTFGLSSRRQRRQGD